MTTQKVESIIIEGDFILFTIRMGKEELINNFSIDYSIKSEIEKIIAPLLVKEIMEKHKDDIVKQVLDKVNWPEIVRSKIAQKIIQEVAQGRGY